MKFFKKINKISIIVLAIAFTLGLGGLIAVRAVVLPFTPNLGAATTYGVLSGTYSNFSTTTTINGDIGYTTGPAAVPGPLGGHPGVTYPNYGNNLPPADSNAGTAQAAALVDLNSQDCTYTFAPGNIDLATDMTHVTDGYGSILGEYIPGKYCTAGASSTMAIGTGGISLNGDGTYVFKSDGALNTVTGSSVTLTGGLASSCDVFWTPNGATTLNHDSNFKGTVIPVSQDITVYSGVAWIGRALTFAHTVTTSGADSSITVPTCTNPHLTVTKVVVGGGSKVAADFPLFIDTVLTTTDVAVEVSAGSHTVTETTDSNYTQSFSASCPGGIITLSSGGNKTCTITNTYTPIGTLHVIKTLTNDSGGTLSEEDFSFLVNGGAPVAFEADGTNDLTVAAGTYSVTETAVDGYATSYDTCTGLVIAADGEATCTITNDDIPAHLIVIKHVVNDDVGITSASSFSTTITGVTTATPTAAGVESPGVDNILTSVGAYSINEGAHVGYAKTLSGDCSGTIALGETKTCTITNDDIPADSAVLTLVKTITNDNGGARPLTDFPLTATGLTTITGVSGTSPVTNAIVGLGVYTLSEITQADYTAGSWSCTNDDIVVNSSSQITLADGNDTTCTINNNDIAAHLIVIKHVVNDNGGTALASSFSTTIADVTTATPTADGVESPGVDNILTSVGAYSIDEGAHIGYDKTLSTDCSGTITLGQTKTCTITNNDIDPGSGGGTVYGCKDPNATNYNFFSSSKPELCLYEPTITIISTPVVVAPFVPKLPKTGFSSQTWYGSLFYSLLNLFR